jgi:N-acetylglucosamine kinase-like BadF-type ATPase
VTVGTETTAVPAAAARPGPPGAVLAIDGGNSKTDVALVAADGSVLAQTRGGGFTPQTTGVPSAIAVAAGAVERLRADLGLPPGPVARHLAAYVAGADLPSEEEVLAAAFAAEGWAETVEVGNDVFALLRAGSSRGWGVAVVCGAGINCVGVGPDGRRARFPALGRMTGDWGGGHYLAEEALWHAVRGEDGRDPRTALTAAVAGHFGRSGAEEVALALVSGELDGARLLELAPVLTRTAEEGDPAAIRIVQRQADEVVALARVALSRLDLLDTPTELVLGGGVLRARPPVLMERLAERAAREIPHADLVVARDAPIIGAALLGFDHLGLTPTLMPARVGEPAG